MTMRCIRDVYIAHDVIVTGDVVLMPGVNLWYGTIIRGDLARITLGERVNIQDQCLLHTDFDVPLDIESDVVVGHGAILHGRRIGHGTQIGMGATVLSGSEIGAECLIAAGALVLERAIIPPRSVVMGIPGKVVRQVTEDDLAKTRRRTERYLELAKEYCAGNIAWPFGKPFDVTSSI